LLSNVTITNELIGHCQRSLLVHSCKTDAPSKALCKRIASSVSQLTEAEVPQDSEPREDWFFSMQTLRQATCDKAYLDTHDGHPIHSPVLHVELHCSPPDYSPEGKDRNHLFSRVPIKMPLNFFDHFDDGMAQQVKGLMEDAITEWSRGGRDS